MNDRGLSNFRKLMMSMLLPPPPQLSSTRTPFLNSEQHWKDLSMLSDKNGFWNPGLPMDEKNNSPSQFTPPSETNFISLYSSKEEIPYRHLDYLGHGSYGYVDKVQSSKGKVFARKVMRISSRLPREMIENEARIIRRLRHPHIIHLEEIYECDRTFGMVMLPVADTDLQELLQQADIRGDKRDEIRNTLYKSIGCLIQAIDYLHEMRVKHKDIKPANILFKDGKPILADFGISKDLLDEETTASLGSVGPHTHLYCAPEVASQEGRRGRAADIFSLGCVFLEIAAAIRSENENELTRFRVHRQGDRNSSAYAACPRELLSWILLANVYEWPGYYPLVSFIHQPTRSGLSTSITMLAFLMLDPDSKERITSRQLVALLFNQMTLENFTPTACHECVDGSRGLNSNLPLHSVFKKADKSRGLQGIDVYYRADWGSPATWEEAKFKWLTSHMWW